MKLKYLGGRSLSSVHVEPKLGLIWYKNDIVEVTEEVGNKILLKSGNLFEKIASAPAPEFAKKQDLVKHDKMVKDSPKDK